MLNVLACDEEESDSFGKPVTLWRYQLAEGITPDVLDPDTVPDLSPLNVLVSKKSESTLLATTDISGTGNA